MEGLLLDQDGLLLGLVNLVLQLHMPADVVRVEHLKSVLRSLAPAAQGVPKLLLLVVRRALGCDGLREDIRPESEFLLDFGLPVILLLELFSLQLVEIGVKLIVNLVLLP